MMFRFTVWRAFTIGYRRGYHRARAELCPVIEETNRETRDTIEQLEKANAKAHEDMTVIHTVRREIAELRARYSGADAEPDEPIRLH